MIPEKPMHEYIHYHSLSQQDVSLFITVCGRLLGGNIENPLISTVLWDNTDCPICLAALQGHRPKHVEGA